MKVKMTAAKIAILLMIIAAFALAVSGCSDNEDKTSDVTDEVQDEEKDLDLVTVGDYHLMPQKAVNVGILDGGGGKLKEDKCIGLCFLMQEESPSLLTCTYGKILDFDVCLGFEYPLSDVGSSYVITEPVSDEEGYKTRLTFVYDAYKIEDVPEKIVFKSGDKNDSCAMPECFNVIDDENVIVDLSLADFGEGGNKLLMASENAYADFFASRVNKLYRIGINKLKDNEVIPETDDMDSILFDKTTLEPLFFDKEVKDQLSADWKISKEDLSGVVVADDNMWLCTDINSVKSVAPYDTWKYLIMYKSYESRLDKGFYYGGDRVCVTTMVYVIDVASGDIVHMKFIGADVPEKNTKTPKGTVMKDEAKEYIRGMMGE